MFYMIKSILVLYIIILYPYQLNEVLNYKNLNIVLI